MNYGHGVWFEASKENVAGELASEAQRVMNEDSARLVRLESYLRLYGGTKARCIKPWQNPANVESEVLGGNADALRLNVVKAAIDTVTAKVGKIRPRPTFLTDGGDFSMQLRAKNLQRFMDGAYHQSDCYEHGLGLFRDAMVGGTAALHSFRHGKRICVEQTPIWELFVDRADALYGKPRCLYRVKWVAKNQVRTLYPKARNADVDEAAREYGHKDDPGYVRVVEAWCLPTCPPDDIGGYEKRADAKDYAFDRCAMNGRHVILAGGVVVCDEDWAYPSFPYVFLHWSKPQQGFWGDSAVTEVAGLQVEINKLLQFIQEAMQKTAQPVVLMHPNAVITPGEPNNLVAQVWKVESDTPLDEAVKIQTFQSVHPQVMQHLWMLYSKAFEILGSNQLAASASAPPGLESGRSLEVLAEEHSERFMVASRHFEHVLGELQARQFIRVAKEIDEHCREHGDSEGYVIRAPNGRAAIRLKWSDVNIDEDGFVMQVFPTSVLPTTPAAKIQEVERLSEAGWISPQEARRLLDFPDMRADTDLATADRDNLARQMELMLEQGEPVMPEPYQDLENAVRVATQSILRAHIDGVPEERIDLVRDFVTGCEALLKRTQTPNPAIPAGTFAGTQNPQAPQVPGAPAPAPMNA